MSCDDENKLLLEPTFVVGPLELLDSEGFCLKAAETNSLATTLLPIFKGDKGDKGDAATVTVGGVTTVAPDQPAAVTNSGDSANAVLDFLIPKGDIGLSAYEVAVANGFAGTEAEWLASLEGPQGIAGPSGDEFANALAVSPVSALRVVSRVAGGVVHSDPSSAASLSALAGLATNAAAAGDNVIVRRVGVQSDQAWSWTPGLPLFVGPSGTLTQTPPTSVAIRSVGVAIDATSILIDLSDLIIME